MSSVRVSAREFNDRFEREAHHFRAQSSQHLHAVRLKQGPLPLDKAMSYAIQIADARAKGVVRWRPPLTTEVPWHTMAL
jgi:hypothetical protein